MMMAALSPIAPRSVRPTAHRSRAETAASPIRYPPPKAGVGLGTRCQVVLSQCRVKVFWRADPAAHTFRAETATTAASSQARVQGLGTRCQVVPFQCRVRVWLFRNSHCSEHGRGGHRPSRLH